MPPERNFRTTLHFPLVKNGESERLLSTRAACTALPRDPAILQRAVFLLPARWLSSEHRRVNNRLKIGLSIVGLAMTASLHAADPDPFIRQLSPDEFASAGLDKLSAAERSRLDALVRAFAARETTAAPRIRSKAMVTPATAENSQVIHPGEGKEDSSAKPGRGWLRRIKLTPGTAIEYETVESELAGTFSGWREGTVFTLGNGQKWRVVSGLYASPPDPKPRRVKVSPGTFGSFFLEIEGIHTRPKVVFAGTTD